MKEILQSLDESVFTPELKLQLQEAFESHLAAITEKYEKQISELSEKSDIYASMIHEEYEAKYSALEEKAREYAEYAKSEYAALEEKVEKYSEYVQEQHEAKLAEQEANIEKYAEYLQEKYAELVDMYLDRVVEEYLQENKLVVEASINESKVKALLEGISSVMLHSGVELSQIVEATKSNSNSNKIAELESELAKVLRENSALKKVNESAKREKIVYTLSENLTLAQKDKFSKLADIIPFVNEEAFTAKLETIKGDLIGSSSKPQGLMLEKETPKKEVSNIKAMYKHLT
jgi:hypothetical protein